MTLKARLTVRGFRNARTLAAALASLALVPQGAWAQRVQIPPGEPMSANPVAAQSKLVEKKGVFDGVERTWYEYVPASYTGQTTVPLVVAVHGGSTDGPWMFKATAWAQIADQVGFIVIYPNGSIGSGSKLRWNGYPEFNTDPGMALSSDNGVDEARFFKALIERTEQTYKVDSTRVYMHGQSNGGMMTSYFGLRYPKMLAAMGVGSAPPSIDVMGKYPITDPLPTYFWSGETDTVSGQYNPKNKSRAALCQEFAEFWARVDKTAAEPELRLDGPYNTQIYEGLAEVRSTEFRNGVHTLPYTAAYLVWNDFFRRFARGADGQVIKIVSDKDQTAGADTGAIAVKLHTPFALVDGKVVRLGRTPAQEPIMAPGAPSAGVLVPAAFLATATGAKADYGGPADVSIAAARGAVRFKAGARTMSLDGKDAMVDAPARAVDGDLMISLRGFADTGLGKTVSSRKDVYKNDIYYINDRPADLSAQTIKYIEDKISPLN